MGVTVSGGAESIAAQIEDLHAAASLFDRAAADAEDVLDYAGSWGVRLVVAGYGWPAAALLDGVLDDVIAGRGHSPGWPRRRCGTPRPACASRLRATRPPTTASSTRSARSSTSSATSPKPASSGRDGHRYAQPRPPARRPSLTADPELVGSAAGPLLFTGLEQMIGSNYPDGHPVVRALGRDTGETVAPHDLTDLVDQLAVRNETVAGEISVAFVTGADGRRRAIVDVPGTKSWSAGRTDDVTSLSTNARALVGSSTTYERGVLAAMTRAGVTDSDQVMLVGHSEGGMVAVTAARDAVRTGRFDVTHVVTAGSPIGQTVGNLPESVRVLALENDADVIPKVDAAANPARPNVTTVHFDHNTGTIGGNHGLGTAYELGAAETDASDDPSVRAFTDSAAGFLDGTDEDTELFLITREY